MQAWNEQPRAATSKRTSECIIHLRKKHRRMRLPNTITIGSIYEKKFLSVNSILEAVVLNAYLLPGTDIFMLNLGDFWSSATMDLYLHRKYYHLVDPNHGLLKKGREIFLTGCHLRSTMEGPGSPRLLPTEYLVILLDEDEDEDAMLLGAQFCSDSFSSISLDAVKDGASYSLFARQGHLRLFFMLQSIPTQCTLLIETIGSLEIHGKFCCSQRKEIILVDNDGVKIKFILWGEQVLLANLFSVGSMLALDRPFIACSDTQASDEICLEYGSATQLYLVPVSLQQEQVLVASTQNRFQGSRLSDVLGQSQGLKVSQVALPCDSQGSIDFSNYPFQTVSAYSFPYSFKLLQSFIVDLRDKMTGISLYGTVRNISRVSNTADVIFSMTIEDTSGSVVAKLHFVRSWSVGRLGLGHTIFISGLTCSVTKQKMLEVSWFEKDVGASFVNLSYLPALLNSSCLHKLSHLSDIAGHKNMTHVCSVRLDQIEYHNLNSRFLHTHCGQFVNEKSDGFLVCNFCCCTCDGEIIRSFYLEVTLADESAKVLCWCTGQTAAELLQISPDEFYELPEDEQAMYLYTLENERFTVALVNCGVQDGLNSVYQENHLNKCKCEIVRALKCE
ncbi:Nucleic acid-binding proteins superfamily isoform 1 [Cinnamomum micranthum f. kanehirae]|uniref:Nucleic acid-binding proteins superfamily isoform 1 n=1 Tax=Cinnamomum micranthum f. kanehirae TaxID=337451 RepID=A0A3S3N1W5_9MAGN|nr:Nucleic acid-binding proteins superfamily isoform 1 [Cinnamomum micranthum f. kanehirae]